MLEIVGVVSIVASLLLVAAEMRQSNQIAAAQTAMQIATAYNEMHLQRATNSEFAKIFPKLEAPSAHLITATDASQIRGIAMHYVSILWAVQGAYDNGLISRKTRNEYVKGLAYTIEKWPAIRPHYVAIYKDLDSSLYADIYAPIADYIASLPEAEVQ